MAMTTFFAALPTRWSGSLPPEGPIGFYRWCVGRAVSAGVRTIVDASGAPLREALAAKPTIVKPNRAELSKTLNLKIDSDEALRDAIKKLIALGPQWAVVSHGKEATIVSDGREFWRVIPPKVDVINPIGSGDALAAGLATALVRGEKVPVACKLAVACACANAMTAMPGEITMDDVNALLPQVEVQAWA